MVIVKDVWRVEAEGEALWKRWGILIVMGFGVRERLIVLGDLIQIKTSVRVQVE